MRFQNFQHCYITKLERVTLGTDYYHLCMDGQLHAYIGRSVTRLYWTVSYTLILDGQLHAYIKMFLIKILNEDDIPFFLALTNLCTETSWPEFLLLSQH